MKMLKGKIWVLFAVVAIAMLPALGAVAQSETVNLVLWHAKQDAEGDALLAIIDAFQAANPNITVEQVYNPSGTLQDSFVAAAGAGEGPDMVIWANDSTGPWATAGLLSDLTGSVDDELLAQASDAAWGTLTYEGAIYGIPFSAKTLSFFYNRALVPEAPETWADVISISEELAADGLTGLAFQNGFFHSAGFLYSLGGSLMDDEGNAAFAPETEGFDAMVAYFDFHAMMYELAQDADSGIVIDGASPNPGFQAGEVAMVYDGIWNLAQFESDLGDDLGVALMPALDNGEVPALFAQSEGFYANATVAEDPAKLEAFIAWSRFVTGEEGQAIAATEGGLLPVNPAVEVENPNLQVFAEQFALGTPFPNRAELGQFWGPMGDAITRVTDGGEDTTEVAASAYETIQAGIDGM
jgi:maltose-binding protein MalE